MNLEKKDGVAERGVKNGAVDHGDCKPQIPDQFMDNGEERTELAAEHTMHFLHLYGVIMIMVLVSWNMAWFVVCCDGCIRSRMQHGGDDLKRKIKAETR